MPLQNPANYLLKVPDPTEAVQKSLETAMQISQMQQRGQLIQAQVQDQMADVATKRAKIEAQQSLQADISTLGPNPTKADYGWLIRRNPQIANEYAPLFKDAGETEVKAFISQGTPILAALTNNRPDLAIGKAQESVEALRNAGRHDDAKALKADIDMMRKDPRVATLAFSGRLLAAMGGDNFAKSFPEMALLPDKMTEQAGKASLAKDEAPGGAMYAEKLSGEQAQTKQRTEAAAASRASAAKTSQETEQDKALFPLKERQEAATTKTLEAGADPETLSAKKRQELAKATKDEADAKYADDTAKAQRDKIKAEITEINVKAAELPKDMRDLVKESGDKATASADQARDARALSSELKTLKPIAGFPAKVAEALTSFTGFENKVSRARLVFRQMRNTGLVEQVAKLRPASDRDVKLLLEGFPEDTSNVKQMTEFLDAMARTQDVASERNLVESEWVLRNRTNGLAVKDFNLRGKPVKAGESFSEFRSRADTEEAKGNNAARLKELNERRAAILKKAGK